MSYRFGDILSWLKDLSPRWVNQECLPPDSLDLPLSAVAELGRADRRAVAFFFSKEYQTELLLTQAGVVITGDAFVEPVAKISPPCWSSAVWIACRDPYLALALISQRFRNGSSEPTGVHPTVVLGPGVALGRGVGIGPFCTVGAGSQIGEGCILFPGVHVYPDTVIGNRVRIHSGAVIGADGFGYAPVVRDGSPEGHCKIEHLGRVVIGDDVEIGANTTIDRGTLGDTVIEDGAKIDNQCQIGHNAKVCRGAIICGNTALAGSSEVGAFAYIGGVTGISNQVRIGEGARVGAGTIVSKDVSPGHKVAGNPQRSFAEHFRAHALLNKLMKKKMSD